ncbi:MAG: ferric reductase-like transmembrane domain-containing protein [Ardenticatenaceae bacterium]|nr:ferric reductase-like transmembrane domain-containing protein [Ardenticatenaceae bacterium]
MSWLEKQKWWLLLNGAALIVMIIVVTQGSLATASVADTFDPLLASGKWAVRFLLFSLSMTPINSYLGWRGAIRLRKPAGLWAFGFTAVHLIYYFWEYQLTMLTWPLQQRFLLYGFLGFGILAALALTSNKWAMRQLKKNWKRLHRLVYVAGLSVGFHAMLATTASKRIFLRDPDVLPELILYFLLVVILLAVRIPLVRRVILTVGRKRPFQLSTD